MNNKKILITGCGGMLGEAVYNYFKGSNTVLATDIDLNEPWLEYLDVRVIQKIEDTIESFHPSIVINLAALTDLEYCENNPEEAWQTNALGQENIARLCIKYDLPVVYISTAGIFDGKKDHYTEKDTPNPINIYGNSKYHGEVFTQSHNDKYFIFRAGWMMGGGVKKDKKFVNKIFSQINNGTKVLHVVDDKLGTPTYTHDFARSMFKVIQTGKYGLYNMVCTGDVSRYDVAKYFIECMGLTGKVRINKVGSSFFEKEYFAPRPKSEKLVNYLLNINSMNYMRDWEICLREYSKNFKLDNTI